MRSLLGVLGVAIVLVALADAVVTILSLQRGGGFLTGRLTRGLWRLALRLQRHFPEMRPLAPMGLICLLGTFVAWMSLTWLGWTLVFSAGETAVVEAQTRLPADLASRIYFAGYTIITLGVGDYVPQGAPWKLATAVAAFNGFFLVTLSITYLVPVLAAVVQKRQLAVYISSLGNTPQEIVLNAWDGRNCQALTQHLPSLTQQLALVRQQHFTYPVTKYFHSSSQSTSLPLRIAVLDEALNYLEYGVAGDCGLQAFQLRPLRYVIKEYMDMLRTGFFEPQGTAPEPASLELLRAGGLKTVEADVFETRVANQEQRRKMLLTLVVEDGREWGDVYASSQLSANSSQPWSSG